MSPKTKEQNETIRQQSITAIKQAALSLFAHKGYASTPISAIAKEAGISKGLMYNYFDSKEELLKAIIYDATLMEDTLFKDVINETFSPKTRLKNLILSTFDWVLSHLEYYKLLISLGFQEEVLSTIKDFIKQKAKAHISLGQQLFEQMGYPKAQLMSLEFGALLDGIFIHLLYIQEDYPIDEMKQFLLDKYELNDNSSSNK